MVFLLLAVVARWRGCRTRGGETLCGIGKCTWTTDAQSPFDPPRCVPIMVFVVAGVLDYVAGHGEVGTALLELGMMRS